MLIPQCVLSCDNLPRERKNKKRNKKEKQEKKIYIYTVLSVRVFLLYFGSWPALHSRINFTCYLVQHDVCGDDLHAHHCRI